MGRLGTPRMGVVAAFIAGAFLSAAALLPAAAAASHTIGRAAVQSRASSCAGLDFHTVDSETGYGYIGDMIYHHITPQHPGGTGFFLCDPKLPQSAMVTKVLFTVFDNFNGDQVLNCALVRTPLAGNVPDSYQVLASVPATGEYNTPGRRRLADSSIVYAKVDNTMYAYWLQCQVTAESDTDQLTGVFGAQVYYLIDPAKG